MDGGGKPRLEPAAEDAGSARSRRPQGVQSHWLPCAAAAPAHPCGCGRAQGALLQVASSRPCRSAPCARPSERSEGRRSRASCDVHGCTSGAGGTTPWMEEVNRVWNERLTTPWMEEVNRVWNERLTTPWMEEVNRVWNERLTTPWMEEVNRVWNERLRMPEAPARGDRRECKATGCHVRRPLLRIHATCRDAQVAREARCRKRPLAALAHPCAAAALAHPCARGTGTSMCGVSNGTPRLPTVCARRWRSPGCGSRRT